jgi:hypothetical protein
VGIDALAPELDQLDRVAVLELGFDFADRQRSAARLDLAPSNATSISTRTQTPESPAHSRRVMSLALRRFRFRRERWPEDDRRGCRPQRQIRLRSQGKQPGTVSRNAPPGSSPWPYRLLLTAARLARSDRSAA